MKDKTKNKKVTATDGKPMLCDDLTIEMPIEIDQNWRMKRYDWEKRKAEFYPVVFARQTIYDKKIPIKRDVWLCWIIKGWLGVTDQMREWLDNNGFEHVEHPSS